jgi:hypothetical protein
MPTKPGARAAERTEGPIPNGGPYAIRYTHDFVAADAVLISVTPFVENAVCLSDWEHLAFDGSDVQSGV